MTEHRSTQRLIAEAPPPTDAPRTFLSKARQGHDGRKGSGAANGASFPRGLLLAQPAPNSTRRFRMVHKGLWWLTLPVFLLVADVSVTEALTSPSSLTATAVSTSQIRLSWFSVNQGELTYSIEQSRSSTSGFVQIGTTGRFTTSYTSGGLAAGTRYYYRVRAIKNGTVSLYSNLASSITLGVI